MLILNSNRYHWSFLVGPKVERKGKNAKARGTMYHVKYPSTKIWEYEERELSDVRGGPRLFVRLLIGKVTNENRLKQIFRGIPVVQNDPSWTCSTWMMNALAAIESDGTAVGTSVLDWATMRDWAITYVAQKIAAGRFDDPVGELPKPTWDLIEGIETVS